MLYFVCLCASAVLQPHNDAFICLIGAVTAVDSVGDLPAFKDHVGNEVPDAGGGGDADAHTKTNGSIKY